MTLRKPALGVNLNKSPASTKFGRTQGVRYRRTSKILNSLCLVSEFKLVLLHDRSLQPHFGNGNFAAAVAEIASLNR